jgi:hypothetical protein
MISEIDNSQLLIVNSHHLFSNFSKIGSLIFILSIPVGIILQKFDQRFMMAILGIGLLLFLFLLVLDILKFRDFDSWGEVGAIIAYSGIFLIFLPFLLLLVFPVENDLFLYSLLLGLSILIIGFTTRATEFDIKLKNLMFILYHGIRHFTLREALTTILDLLKNLIIGVGVHFFLGVKNFGRRIIITLKWIIKEYRYIAKSFFELVIIIIPQRVYNFSILLIRNYYVIGLLTMILYVVNNQYLNPLLKIELFLIFIFFTVFSIFLTSNTFLLKIGDLTRKKTIKQVVSMHSILTGSKLETSNAVFCSQCLRGISISDYTSLIKLEAINIPKCPYCAAINWIKLN